ncbi:MAG: hypothetical protein RSG52_02580 [Terrisporobacter sp.]|uniref:hypothetical protein n=1 Tax=Terrisporobacter sp. TaxID=1965305 RepID=UPI002FC6C5EA
MEIQKKLMIFAMLMTLLLTVGCSNTQNYTEFQNAYFEISKVAGSDKSFNKKNLESIIGAKVSQQEESDKEGNYNSYIFEVDDEELKVFLKSDNKVGFIQYTKLGEVTLTNNLEKNTAIGEYGEGITSEIKLDSLEQQKKIFDETNK